jgi:hypothetical protein
MATNQNNQEQVREVQTRGYRTFNSNAIKATAFEWSYQGDMLKLIITPELPENEQTEKRRYDYQHSWITCISRPKCIDLWNQIEEKILPALANKTEKFISVPVAEVNQFGIGLRADDKQGVVAYAKLIRNIDAQTLKSSDEIVYEFRKGEVIEDYDNSTGKFGGRTITENELYLFLEDTKSFIHGSSKAFNHANRTVDKSYKDMLIGDIRSIGNKVGAEMSTPYSAQRAGARFGQTSLFDSSSMNAPTDQITSLDDLNIQFEGAQ